MSAYATAQLKQSAQLLCFERKSSLPTRTDADPVDVWVVLDQLLDRLVERVAVAVAERITSQPGTPDDEWLDSREAAAYLGLHRDTLRRLAASRVIPTEQDRRGCKLFFRRAALDEWRRTGGRVRHLAIAADSA